ncbi:MAG: helix-turn-helix domain-containing protein [Solirubrobacteraceae bacterium]
MATSGDLRRVAYATGDLKDAQIWSIKAANDFRCHYCHRQAKHVVGAEGIILGIDHVVPIARGGPHTASNIVPCCTHCNAQKGARPAQSSVPDSSLAAFRAAQFLSQADLAQRSKISKATIANIELGNRKPIGRTARALAEALGVEPGTIDWPASNSQAAGPSAGNA